MIAPPIRGEDPSPDNLFERIEPRSWAHLGGPMRWYNILDDQVRRDETYGNYVRVETRGEVGQMVRHFSEHGTFPRQVYLFAGPKGVGKTALIRLMAVSHVAEDHEAVSYGGGSGGEEITMIDAETGEPFCIDPVTTESRGFETVRREMRRNNEDEVQPKMVEAYNAGQLNKAQVDEIAGNVNQPLLMFGGRRVIILNEIDQLGGRQTPSLKSKLDPGGGIPEGFLLLSDTNHLGDVRSSMDAAGMDRFEVVQFPRWKAGALTFYARTYVQSLGVAPEEGSFGAEDPVGELAAELATRSGGSIRALISALQALASQSGEIAAGDVAGVFEEASEPSAAQSNSFLRFRNGVVGGRVSAATFAHESAKRSVDATGFANKLARHLMKSHPEALAEELAGPMQKLFQIAQTPEGRPATDSRWAAMAGPLRRVAEVIQR